MKRDLFIWTIVTAIIFAIIYFILDLVTSNDFYFLILLIIPIISIILYTKSNPEKAFKSGGIIGLVCIVTMILSENLFRFLLIETLFNIGILIVAFLIGGVIGYLFRKRQAQIIE